MCEAREANVKKDTQILDEVVGFVTELRDTWAEAMKDARIKQSGKMPTQEV